MLIVDHFLEKYSEEYAKENSKFKINVNEDVAIQPVTIVGWRYQENKMQESVGIQPVTVVGWKYNEDKIEEDVAIQPVTVVGWKYKEDKIQKDVTIQPVTVVGWKYKEDNIKEISHDDNMNSNHEDLTSGSLFFVEKSLQLGTKLKHDFQQTSQVPFMPKHVVQSIPFDVDKFTEIIHLFSLNNESAQAIAIKETLGICLQRPKVKKENRTCAESIEEVVDFAIGELGTNNIKLRMMEKIEVPNGIQEYVITKLNKLEVAGNTAVACHRMSYPYVVYYCHHQQDIGHYDVTLVSPAFGYAIQTTAVCHYDTYAWKPDVPALRHLGINPGDAPVCHFSAINDMFWSLKAMDILQ